MDVVIDAMVKEADKRFLLDDASQFLREGRWEDAQRCLGMTVGALSKEDFTQALIALEEGVQLFRQARQSEAIPYLEKAKVLIDIVSEERTKLFLNIVINFSQGITRLLKGDAHGALSYLEISKDTMQKIAFFMPEFKKSQRSYQLACHVALARAALNVGDIANAETWAGRTKDYQILEGLDLNDPVDVGYFFEVHETRLEFVNTFVSTDLQVLDFEKAERRLETVKNDAAELRRLAQGMPEGAIRNLANVTLLLNEVLGRIVRIGKEVLVNRRPLDRAGVTEAQQIQQLFFDARHLAQSTGDRGQAYISLISRLELFVSNLLSASKAGKNDFGRLGGLISSVTLLVSLSVIQTLFKPTGTMALLYFFGAFIMALIVGFGYGALKFIPLLKLYGQLFNKDK